MVFRGWEDCYRLTNREFEAVVVPQVARIMRYGPVGGGNLLWVNDETTPAALGDGGEPPRVGGWINYGGYKLWPAPQKDWGWPPPAELDAGPCTVEVLGDGAICLTGSPGPKEGVRFDRIIRLAATGSRLDIDQVMVNVSQDRTVTWAIWDVTQVPGQGVAFAPLGQEAEYRVETKAEPGDAMRAVQGMLRLEPAAEAYKAFISGPPGWLGCICEGWLFVKAFDIDEAPVPEPETAREIWVGPTGYMELEIVGPAVTLRPGESTRLAQTWEVFPMGGKRAWDTELVERIGAVATVMR
jgi:hypothetical protein